MTPSAFVPTSCPQSVQPLCQVLAPWQASCQSALDPVLERQICVFEEVVWQQGDIADCQAARKAMEQACSNHDGALMRYLGHGMADKAFTATKLRKEDPALRQQRAAADLTKTEVHRIAA